MPRVMQERALLLVYRLNSCRHKQTVHAKVRLQHLVQCTEIRLSVATATFPYLHAPRLLRRSPTPSTLHRMNPVALPQR